MSFADKKGITVASGFRLPAAALLDARGAVDTIAERDELVTLNAVTDGLRVYVKADKTLYIWHDNQWIAMPKLEDLNGLANSMNSAIQSAFNSITATKEKANGIASLDENGKVPSSQLPSYVDDVIEGYLSEGKFYKESAHTTEITGESGKIYVDLTTSKTYRWSGTAYAVISETIALGETSSTAYRGDRGKTAYDHSLKTSGNPHKVTKSDVGLGNVPNVTTDNQTPSFTPATTLANITSKEKLSDMLGKIAKAIADFISHKGDKTSHITSAERIAWNAKSEFSGNYGDLNGAPVKITFTSPDCDYICLENSKGQAVGDYVQIPTATADHPGFMTPQQLAMLSINETELDTAVTAALNEASA